jgi:micrococcal nuclease
LTTPIKAGKAATAAIKTSPRAACDIDVAYKSGSATAKGLGPKQASSAGVASWTWTVGLNTSKGSWPVTVWCELGEAFGSTTRDLEVL